MPAQILMPALPPAMGDGTLSRWLVEVGDPIVPGMVIAEIETASATMEIEAVDAGRIARILVFAGADKLAAGTPIAEIALPHDVTVAAPDVPSLGAPVGDTGLAGSPRKGVGPVSPLARRLAQQMGLALSGVRGTGPNGRIVKRDVEAAAAARQGERTAALVATAPDASPPPPRSGRAIEVMDGERSRRALAERLTRAACEVPHAYLTVDCRLDEMFRTRARINADAAVGGPRACRLTINDFVVKAWALAMHKVPSANVTCRDGRAVRQFDVDVAVAVACDRGVGCVVIRQAHARSLSEISREIRALGEDLRRRGDEGDAWVDCATTISNLGMYGIKSFDSVVLPPQTSLLAVGAAEQRPVVSGARLDIGTVMTCTLSCDQRVIDGAVGAKLLAVFKALIEEPVRMLV